MPQPTVPVMVHLDIDAGDAVTPNLMDLTIAIPVRNEERNLDICLQAIGSDLARQVVVIYVGQHGWDRFRCPCGA